MKTRTERCVAPLVRCGGRLLIGVLLLAHGRPASGVEAVAPAPQPAQAAPGILAIESHEVNVLAFAPDGQTLVGGGADGKIHFWRVQGGEFKTIESGEPKIRAMCLSADGQTLTTVGKKVKTWKLPDGAQASETALDMRNARDASQLFAISADGTLVAGQLGGREALVTVWNAASGEIAAQLEASGFPLDAAFSPDGGLLAIGAVSLGDGSSRGGLRVYDLKTGKLAVTIEAEPLSISSVAFSLDGLLVAGGDHRKVRVWDVHSGELRRTFEGHSGPIEAICFSPDGATLASGGQGPELRSDREWRSLSEVKIWNSLTGRVERSLVGRLGRAHWLAYSPDGKRLARCDDASVVCEELEGGHSWVKYFD